MSLRSMRNGTNQMELQMNVCQWKKTHFKKEKSGPLRAKRLCRFLEQMGYFVPNSISASVRARMCVIHWFSVYLSLAASWALFEQACDFCCQGSFNAFLCSSFSFCVCLYIHVCICSILYVLCMFNQMFLAFLAGVCAEAVCPGE